MKWFNLIFFFLIVINPAYGDEIDNLVPHIIAVESSGNPDAISNKSCRGLMQVSEIVYKEYLDNQCRKRREGNSSYYQAVDHGFLMEGKVMELYNPTLNKIIGTWYLRRLRDHYLKDKYTIERMLSAYNGGITKLRKNNYDVNKMPKESKAYVNKVMALYNDSKTIRNK